jgi:hypothetical protein
MKLLQIRKVRLDLLAELERGRDFQDFSRLVALDRYERLAHTKRRRASEKLAPDRWFFGNVSVWNFSGNPLRKGDRAMDEKSSVQPMDEKHTERLLDAAKRAAKALKENPPPDTFIGRKTQTDD